MEKTAKKPPWKTPKSVSHFPHSSGDELVVLGAQPCLKSLGLFLEGLVDGWIGELLVEIAFPCGFHLRLFSFAVALARSTVSP
jgi:hypothetical protein